MAADVHSREQRLRKQAELQSHYVKLASLRERQASYIDVSAAIPELLVNQIKELRQEIDVIETELLALNDESLQTPARQYYREGFEAEQANDLDRALKLYRSASRHAHPDGNAAARSVRHLIKVSKSKPTSGQSWTPGSVRQSRNRLLVGLAVLLVLVLLAAFAIRGSLSTQSNDAVAEDSVIASTATPSTFILIVPDTATPLLTHTPTETLAPTVTDTPRPAPTEAETPTLTPVPSPMLRAAPRILEPKDGLVWGDGAVVFEFAKQDLAYDELYCLNTLKGYDKTNTENWSFPSVSSKVPSIPIEANVFRVAKVQGIRCIIWSASIGKGSCENIASESTEERTIGLPRCEQD